MAGQEEKAKPDVEKKAAPEASPPPKKDKVEKAEKTDKVDAAAGTPPPAGNPAAAAESVAPVNATSGAVKSAPFDPSKLGILNDVSISVTIEVGRAQIKIKDLLNLTKGSVIELDKSAGDPVDIYANGKLISIGNIITANGKYCVRLTSMPENSNIGIPPDGK